MMYRFKFSAFLGENLKESSQKTGESTAEIDNKDKEDNESETIPCSKLTYFCVNK